MAWSTCSIETGKSSKGEIDLGFKNKRAGRLISRRLISRKPLSSQPLLNQPYNFVDNLPPCLKHIEGFPGIKLGNKSTVHVGNIPVHNCDYSQETVAQSKCGVCLSWIARYYTDIPILQSQVKALTDQIGALTNENHRLESVIQSKGKRIKTTGNVTFKNVEVATAIVNSKII
jgi:hypothetical protein